MSPETIARLNRRIQTDIPLAHAAGIQLESGGNDTLVAHAPLALNGNPHGSVFGGSQYVAALVAGYAQTVLIVEQVEIDATVVISHAQANYHHPLHSDITARVAPLDEKAKNRFIRMLQRRGRGRLNLTISIVDGRITAFELHACFAAIAP